VSNHIDPASAAWGLSLGLMLGAWIHDTLKNPGRRMVRPKGSYGSPRGSNGNCEPLPPPPPGLTLMTGPLAPMAEGRTIRGSGNGRPSYEKSQLPLVYVPPRIIREDFLS